jgi:3-oxoacyl-[acyl-carrier protein] reductase
MKNIKALVCGASQGIGEAVARALAREGHQVVLLARSGPKLEAVCRDLPGQSHRVISHDMGDITGLQKKVQAELEQGPFQILINNSGGPKGGPLLQASAEEFSKAFSEHLLVSQTLAQLLVPGMKAAGFGRIVNIISTSVKVPIPNLGVSNTIRAAVANWAKTLSQEVGPFGITVNNVLPGFTLTPRFESLRRATAEKLKISEAEVETQWKSYIPLARFAEPREIAEAVSFLASSRASYINGVNLPVDGGRTQSL